jgi:type I restriction enzyme, R subunit
LKSVESLVKLKMKITESSLEQFSLSLLEKSGYHYIYGPDIAPDSQTPSRSSFEDVLLPERLSSAVARINPGISSDAREDAIKQILRLNSPELITNNESFHRMLTEGIKVTLQKDGNTRGDLVCLIDFNSPENNDFLVVNQFTVVDNNVNKRPDIVLFINGLPLVVIELKNPADENATVYSAYQQIQTYKQSIPRLFAYNGFTIISDGLEARAGTISAGFSRFMAWKTTDGMVEASPLIGQLETLIKGMLCRSTLLDLVRHFIVFERSTKLTPSQREGHHYRAGMNFTGMINQVREMRKNQTKAEEIFWELVRNKRFMGLKFRRQHQMGHYVVDFYCDSAKLIIELDGEIHDHPEQEKKDGIRDKYLNSLGNKVLRFTNDELFLSAGNVLKAIEEIISPSGRDEREGGITSVTTIKKLAAYHQYYAVNRAVESTLRASGFVNPVTSTSSATGLGQGTEPVEVPSVKESPANYGLPDIVSQPVGDKKGGVVWHTQGSGKSLSMVFYTGKIVLAMDNPTVVVITDRNDLDDQLFDTFAGSKQLLRQEPVQAENREHLKELLKVASGGIVFTTIQKFQPEEGNVYERLSDRKNIIVIADEAHRTQYGFKAKTIDAKNKNKTIIGKKIVYGFAKYMRDALPNATYLGFTGTPIENTDVNTPAVFGNYVDVYDISQAVIDGATVKIYYESRLAKIGLSKEGRKLVSEFDEELNQDDLTQTQKAKAKWTQLEGLIGSSDRIKRIAQDIITHFELRQEVINGKGMIVTMSRRIAAELYSEIIKIRPQWYSNDMKKGVIKVVMTSASSDGPEISKHHTTKDQRRALAERMKDPEDELKLVIVRDMWLTGFDAPCLKTLYIDKPMKGHTLMQAIARVNRVYGQVKGGLVVDYLGIAADLKKALSFYSDSGGKGDPAITQEKAVQLMLEKLEIVSQMFHLPAPPPGQYCVYAIECENGSIYIGQTSNLGKRWQEHLAGTASEHTRKFRPVRIAHFEDAVSQEDALQKEHEWKTGFGRKRIKRLIQNGGARQAGGFAYEEYFEADTGKKLSLILAAEEHILELDNGKKRFVDEVTALSQAFSIAIPHEQAMDAKDEIAFFQAVKARLSKFDRSGSGKTDIEIETAIRQVIDKALVTDQVIDVFDAAGIKKPDISILSEEFLLEVQHMEHKHIALEVLKKLLNDEIKARVNKNLIQGKSLMEMLENSIKRYHNKILTAAEVIEELINLGRDIKEMDKEPREMGLSDSEYAFYCAVANNESARQLMKKETLRELAVVLFEKVRENASIDWTIKESVKAKLKVIVKRILRQFGYPPDMQMLATETVLKQAEMIADEITKGK